MPKKKLSVEVVSLDFGELISVMCPPFSFYSLRSKLYLQVSHKYFFFKCIFWCYRLVSMFFILYVDNISFIWEKKEFCFWILERCNLFYFFYSLISKSNINTVENIVCFVILFFVYTISNKNTCLCKLGDLLFFFSPRYNYILYRYFQSSVICLFW